MKFTLALIALVAPSLTLTLASPFALFDRASSGISSTTPSKPSWNYNAALKQLASDIDAGKTLNWTIVAQDISAWQSQALDNAKIASSNSTVASSSSSSSSSSSLKAAASSSASSSSSKSSVIASALASASASASGSSSSSASKALLTPNASGGSKASSSAPVSSSSSSSKAATPSSSSSSSSKATTPSSSSSSAKASASASASASSSSSAGAATASQDTVNKDQFLALHNDFRPKYGASVVTWNDTLAAYAFKAASTCKYGHTNGPFGENIAAGVGGGYNVKMGFQSWSNESALYNWSKPGYNESTGHFTQIVWKATSQIGCAAVTCPDGSIFTGYKQTSLYLVCEYQQPGNWYDPNSAANTAKYFTDNVGKYQG